VRSKEAAASLEQIGPRARFNDATDEGRVLHDRIAEVALDDERLAKPEVVLVSPQHVVQVIRPPATISRQRLPRYDSLSPPVAERFDAHIRTTAYRLHMAARGARMPKKNDGADASLTLHLGAGCILLTDERKLVDIIDESGTFQAPWVRQSQDLDDLPQIPAWGEQARNVARAFRRKR
jgi:hypothetical protein